MVRIRHTRDVVRYRLEVLRIKHIINPEHRPEGCEGRSETVAGLDERILPSTGHAIVCIRHRIVIEIAADE